MHDRLARCVLVVLTVFCWLGWAGRAHAQTASSASVVGTVTDPSGAAVAGARVELKNTATGAITVMTTNQAGEYVFPHVMPGTYEIRASMQGFRTTTISGLVIQVLKSYTVNVTLQLGEVAQTVEVQATSAVELETTSAQVGNVVGQERMLRLPTLTRSATELLNLQPAVSLGTGAFPRVGVRVAGAIDDQNTVTLNGIDITDNVIAGTSFGPTVIPIPVDSVQEFRVGVNNPNASFDRSSGGQVALVTRSGTNDFHGALYAYHQNWVLNANSWENNRLGIQKPHIIDNRDGFSLGGPILKNKTFVFGNYEHRHFNSATNILRFVPTPTLRQGILRFRDGSGNIVSYPLATASVCGPSGNLPCDPRGLGISPTVQALWNLEPAGNDPSSGDGLNTVGFRATVPTPIIDDFVTFRFDQVLASRWQFHGTYMYARDLALNASQVDIRGGNVRALRPFPNRGDGVIAWLDGQIRPNLLNSFHFGWIRSREEFNALAPSATAALLNLPGTASPAGPIAIAPALAQTGFLDAPIDVDTQRARFQTISQRNIQWVDDLTWIKGSHTAAFGFNIQSIPTMHVRNDKVVGSLTSLVAVADADVSPFLTIPSANRPPTCTASLTTGCLLSSDVQRWDRLYAATLGLVDNISILVTRDGNLKALPFGTPLINDDRLHAYYMYAQDTWRIIPSLTLTYGLAYGWQTAPKEKLDRQTLLIDNTTGQVLTARNYLSARQGAALRGNIYNPQLAYAPIRSAPVDNVFETDWGDVAPRIAAAWNPSFGGKNWLLARLFGDRKAVLRGGFSIVYDRTNTVQSVIIPMLGVGFAQTINVRLPNCTASGTPGPNCNTAGGNPGASAFRIGVDGTLPLPTVPSVQPPIVPSTPFGELLSFQVDPNTHVGRSYSGTLTYQRELPGNMLLELGWIGRWSSHLPEAVNFNAAPYFFVDPASGQSFAQAFDAVATQLRRGQPVTPQPWFENQLPGLGTNFLVSTSSSAFINGLVSSLFTTINLVRSTALNLPPFINLETLESFVRTYEGKANYQGMLVTLHKRLSNGLVFDLNYTLSKALDNGIANQNSAGFFSNSFFPNASYGPTLFDRRHVFNANFYYELPFGPGHRLTTGHEPLNKLIGGWYTSGIFIAQSGLPEIVVESNQVWGGGSIFPNAVGAIPTRDVNSFNAGVHSGVTSTCSFGSAGNPANHGTGLNLFADPCAVANSYRPVLLSVDGRDGRGHPIYGLGMWNLDLSLGKRTTLHSVPGLFREGISFIFTVDFFNVFNHVNFNDPALNLQQPQTFGVITSQFVPANRQAGSRWIQGGLRVEW
jgi:hypothetical protein